MRYLTIALVTGLLLTTSNYSTKGQILNRLKKKAQEAAARKAEEKMAEQLQQMAEQMVEKSWNSIFGEMSPDSAGHLPFVMNKNVSTEDEYFFDTITTMEIQNVNEQGKAEEPVKMDMHFNTNKMYTGTSFSSENLKKEEGELFIIYDFGNSAMLMLMNNGKNKFSFAYDWKHALEIPSDSTVTLERASNAKTTTDEWPNYTKIGTKNILGYTCDGYQTQTDNEEVEIWVTQQEEYGMNRLFKAQTNARQIKNKVPDDYPVGMVMELISKNINNGETTTMKVTDINKNANVRYVMADYPTMSFGDTKPEN